MSFTVLDCEQRSPAWFQARAGVLTATGAAAMLSTLKNGKDPIGKHDLRWQLAIEARRGRPIEDDPFESFYMKRGREREVAGIGRYEAITGEIVQRVGFIRHDTWPIGCSPDGIVGDFDGGLELKCPKFTTHCDYLKANTLPSEYAAQITHSLYVTELPWWDFCSYCPDVEGAAPVLFVVRVFAAAIDLDAYALAVQLFLSEVETVKETLDALRGARELVHG